MNKPPNRLSIDKASDFYDRAALDKGVEVFFNGVRQVNNVVEYDVEASLLRRQRKTALGKMITDEYHQPVVDELNGLPGSVVAIWRCDL